MKIFFICIFILPAYLFGQFNTVRNLAISVQQKHDTIWQQTDTISVFKKSLDSLAWRMVCEQFIQDKTASQAQDTSFHFHSPLRSIQVTSPFGWRFHPIEKV